MGRKKKSSSAKVLMILWLITAATALIVTVVYFGEMQKMYTAVTDAAENGGKSSDGTGTSDIKVADNDANTKAEVSPTDKIEKTTKQISIRKDKRAETGPIILIKIPEIRAKQERITVPTPVRQTRRATSKAALRRSVCTN